MATWSLTANQVRALYEACPRTRESARDRAILCLCVDAGLRRREIPGLRVRSVDLERSVVSIGSGPSRRLVRLGAESFEAVAPFLRGRRGTDPLLVSRSGEPVTDRIVHEQLRRLGELAGMGEWVTNRHTRHTFVEAVAGHYSADIVLRIAGHAGHRVKAASAEFALRAQMSSGWTSPLDEMLGRAGRRRVA